MGKKHDFFFFSSRRRHTRYWRDWSSDVCSSDLNNLSNLKEKSFKRKFDCYSKAPSKTLEKISLKKL